MNKIQTAIVALAERDAKIFPRPNESATDVQRQVTGRKVNFDTLGETYDAYVEAFWKAKSEIVERERETAAQEIDDADAENRE